MRSHTAYPVGSLRQQGFSIIETMVAVALSLIVLAGVMAVMYSSKVIFNENERVGRVQENGRAALELILRDLRGAGFPGCAQPIDGLFAINNRLSNNEDVEWNLAQPVFGYNSSGSATWTPGLDTDLIPDAVSGNDIIVVRSIPAGSPSMRVSSQVNPTSQISLQKDLGENLVVGAPAVISDCGNASIFVVTGFTAGADDLTATVDHGTGGGPPENDSDSLAATFTIGARVAPITTIVYYISNPNGTGPSLWRVVGDAAPQEVVPGVEAMQIKYGVDTNGDGNINSYVDASATLNWNQVVSVSLAMLVRSDTENAQEVDRRQYTLLDTTLAAFNDNFQRSLFTTTVTLRNRTL